jgi:glucose/arabinose dehydrogenase
VTPPPGDSHRLFIVTRTGVIRVAVDGVLQPAPFLDISAQVWADPKTEAGMTGMAFDPDYTHPSTAGYGRFYVAFAGPPANGDQGGPIHVDEFTVASPETANLADATTKREVLTIPHTASAFHYGGTIQFGPNDGLLYIGTGDAQDGPNLLGGNAQNTKKSLLGKILRIDPHQSGADPYSIPADNPFHGEPLCSNGAPGTADCPETLAWGFRNPFRWSFDRATGDIAIGDVGEDLWEEVDFVPASTTLAKANFGWPCYEGAEQVYYFGVCAVDPRVDPVLAYPHPATGAVAITGGVVVRDPGLGSLVGRYLWADFFAGEVHSLHLDLPTATDDRVESGLGKVKQLVSFGEDADGHVYIVQLHDLANPNDPNEGSVQRLVCSDCAPAPGGTGTSGSGTSGDSSSQQTTTQPPGPSTTSDKAPPRLGIRGAHLQNVLRSGIVRLSVSCDESCAVRATGKARGLALRGVSRHLQAGKRATLELRASKRVRRALKRHGVVVVSLRCADAAGNVRTASYTVRVKRR